VTLFAAVHEFRLWHFADIPAAPIDRLTYSTACLGRLEEISMQLVMLDLHWCWDFEIIAFSFDV
jgi:hypothetical protein